ncbi:MAG: bacterial transcriptional activator domain-containing protein, partial [Actinomycetota bacterium]
DASTTPVTDDWFDTAPTRTAATDDTAAAARPPSPAVTSATTTTTTTPPLAPPDPGQTPTERPDATPSEAPAPLGIEHAGMLAGGLLMLAAVRRRRRLRAAIPRARIPEPPPSVVETERVLRSIGGAERAARLDVAIRALAHRLVGTGVQPGAVLYADDGTIEVVLTGDAAVGAPWSGDGRRWELAPSMPLELLAEDARHVGSPCPALVSIGRIQAPDGARSDMASDIDAGGDLFLDLEAAGVLVVDAPPVDADSVVTSLAATIASSSAAETAHIVTSGLPERAVFDHPNATGAASAGEAIERALGLLGSTLTADRGTFDLRVRRTGGEAWEPAIVLLGTTRSEGDDPPWSAMPEPGRGLAAVVACPHADVRGGARLTAATPAWRFDAFGWQVDVHPAGLDSAELARLTELLDAADQAPIPDESAERVDADLPVRGSDGEAGPVTTAARGPDGPGDDAAVGGRPEDSAAAAFAASDDADEAAHRGRPGDPEPEHAIVVRLLGGVSITDADGATRAWQRSKTVELIAWLATHRHRSTRSAARTAMWADEVRDATFSNVVSEARRGLARLVEPPSGEEWIPRTLTEELPLHHAVVTDLDLIEARLTAARLAAPAEAIGLLRPTMSSVRGLPFADTAYLWPDADGLVTNATLLATTACAELAGHALSLGDIDTVFEATRHGLSVLPGHEELIALRMRAHARAGDLSGVRSEWESYERVLNADAWSDGEPAPKLLDLRRELLSG